MNNSILDDVKKTAKNIQESLQSTEEMTSLVELVTSMVEHEEAIASVEGILESLKNEHKELNERKIPNTMQSMGVNKITMDDGTTVSIKTDYYAHIRKDDTAMAYNWFRKIGMDGIIKNDITVKLNAGDDKKAKEVNDRLKKTGVPFTQKESIHAGTLNKVVKEIVNGEIDIDEEIPPYINYALVNKTKLK